MRISASPGYAAAPDVATLLEAFPALAPAVREQIQRLASGSVLSA